MKNIPASIKARLSNQAKLTNTSLLSLLERFAIGRLLWRLSQSEPADRFVLKGAQLFALWADQPHRPTRDIDFLSHGDPSTESIQTFFKELLSSPADPEDGLIWTNIKTSYIREDQHYGGVRVSLTAMLERTRIPAQIDIGFGDTITPAVEHHTWKDLLDFPEARLLTYPPETVIAEKFQAAVELQLANSRMKDFFDLNWLSSNRSFDFAVLRQAVHNTFECRNSPIPEDSPICLLPAFAKDPSKTTQWNAFLRKNKLPEQELTEVIATLHTFLTPLISPEPQPFTTWTPAIGWQ